MARNALGKGLGALIREPEPTPLHQDPANELARDSKTSMQVGTASVPATQAGSQRSGTLMVDIDLIEPSPYQPRTRFREEALEELAQSIKSSGIIQPLVLRPIFGRSGPKYQLLAGERRWRAAQRAGLMQVPAVLREVSDAVALEITLIENIQREDLNPVEEARAFERLSNEFNLTQEEISARTGKERTTIANSLRLLRLDRPILDLIEDGRLTSGHGRALLGIPDAELRVTLARRAARGTLTVRQLERSSARRARAAAAAVAAPEQPLDANTKAALEQLQSALGTRVTLRLASKKKPGELAIEYYDEAQLAGIWDRLMGEPGQRPSSGAQESKGPHESREEWGKGLRLPGSRDAE